MFCLEIHQASESDANLFRLQKNLDQDVVVLVWCWLLSQNNFIMLEIKARLEAAGSGEHLGTVDIPVDLLDSRRCSFFDLQQCVLHGVLQGGQDNATRQVISTSYKQSFEHANFQVRIFDGHSGPELTSIDFPPNLDAWLCWQAQLAQLAQLASTRSTRSTRSTSNT